MCFPSFTLALSDFFPPLVTRCLPEKVNLNLIIFYVHVILTFKEISSL